MKTEGLKREKFILLLTGIINDAITTSPHFHVLQDAIILASDDPEERLSFWLEALDALKAKIHANYKDNGLISSLRDS